MTVYVAEISGRGIAAFNAVNDADAESYLANKEFLHHLIVFQNQGRPLWDGISEIECDQHPARRWRLGSLARRLMRRSRLSF